MSNKPKWSVELHGTCPFPDMFDVVEIAADLQPSGVAVGETAYFIGTGVGDTNYNDVDIPLDFAPGTPRRGWLSVVDGAVHLSPAAGACVVTIIARVSGDWSGTTIPDADFNIFGNAYVKRGETGIATSNTDTLHADGETALFSADGAVDGRLVVGGVLRAQGMFYAENNTGESVVLITDGVSTLTAVVQITRIAPAPVLPA